MQNRAVAVSRYHASQLPQPLPQYNTMIGRSAADDVDADLHGTHSVCAVCSTLVEYWNTNIVFKCCCHY